MEIESGRNLDKWLFQSYISSLFILLTIIFSKVTRHRDMATSEFQVPDTQCDLSCSQNSSFDYENRKRDQHLLVQPSLVLQEKVNRCLKYRKYVYKTHVQLDFIWLY